jgi:hypothetical protein
MGLLVVISRRCGVIAISRGPQAGQAFGCA